MPQARLLYASRIHFASRKFNTFHGNSLNPTDTTNYSLFSHGFFETNPYAEIITKRTSNDRKITHPKSTGRKPGCKTFHPAMMHWQRDQQSKDTLETSIPWDKYAPGNLIHAPDDNEEYEKALYSFESVLKSKKAITDMEMLYNTMRKK